ncbi:hypothetical protein FB565_008860 [Actinoplanes lutulentus]|uniref:Polyketide cyclase/dehydrase/lipid transport protein n=1 Tax=Actinoplanes lutulentus TaxID=1287878 RepID=A0A327ZA44_9ACTN|nr:hypothetical protein [Actinoplanes lutulentus]MBB2949055.1 hypothetical protein [Actinoplanes lutulentus]RAK31378.1 hypothetical protein B0I29_115185 [Actinoplanes lutulentus]
MKKLFESSATVAAPVEAVRKLIDDGWVTGAFLGSDTARDHVDVDHQPGTAGFQGHWWYRGEITASPAGPGTTLTYRVYNIAAKAAWAVPLANRLFIGYQKTVDDGVAGLARRIEDHLRA